MRSVGDPSKFWVSEVVAAPGFAPALRLLPGGGGEGEREGHAELQSRARRALDAAPDGNEPLGALWDALVTGREHAVHSYHADGRSVVVVRRARPDERLPSLANARNRALLTRVLLGEPQKIVALDFNISPSSVAAIAAQYAEAMGFGEGVSRLPLLLVMAAHAAAHGDGEARARSASFDHGAVSHRALAVTPPDPARWGLSVAECQVAALLLERHRNADIARLRHTSSRTVANQVGSVMHKLGARGRSEIIAKMVGATCR